MFIFFFFFEDPRLRFLFCSSLWDNWFEFFFFSSFSKCFARTFVFIKKLKGLFYCRYVKLRSYLDLFESFTLVLVEILVLCEENLFYWSFNSSFTLILILIFSFRLLIENYNFSLILLRILFIAFFNRNRTFMLLL